MKRRRTYKRTIFYFLLFLILWGIIKREKPEPVIVTESTETWTAQEEVEDRKIRVLLMTTGYANITHPSVTITAPSGIRLSWGEQTEDVTEIELFPDDPRLLEGKLFCEPIVETEELSVASIERGYGAPSYGGRLELRSTAEGIVLINELFFEDYLCKVVPSEMPASYEAEALKVQAVCARSYGIRQLQGYGYPEYEAHVNDSTDFQVYNNSASQEETKQAVYDTKGEILSYDGQIARTYYYSTSCGKTTDLSAWGSESVPYLQSVAVSDGTKDYEEGLPWYRWKCTISAEELGGLISLHTGTDIGKLQEVTVTKRGAGEVALQVKATGTGGEVTVETENKIRGLFGGGSYSIEKADETTVPVGKLLPSAFFQIEKQEANFLITGGGFGHGIGMSQNGANEMAKQGKTYKEILQLFYPGSTLEPFTNIETNAMMKE